MTQSNNLPKRWLVPYPEKKSRAGHPCQIACGGSQKMGYLLEYFLTEASWELDRQNLDESCKVVVLTRSHKDIFEKVKVNISHKSLIDFLKTFNEWGFVKSERYGKQYTVQADPIREAMYNPKSCKVYPATSTFIPEEVLQRLEALEEKSCKVEVMFTQLQQLQLYNFALEARIEAMSREIEDLKTKSCNVYPNVEALQLYNFSHEWLQAVSDALGIPLPFRDRERESIRDIRDSFGDGSSERIPAEDDTLHNISYSNNGYTATAEGEAHDRRSNPGNNPDGTRIHSGLVTHLVASNPREASRYPQGVEADTRVRVETETVNTQGEAHDRLPSDAPDRIPAEGQDTVGHPVPDDVFSDGEQHTLDSVLPGSPMAMGNDLEDTVKREDNSISKQQESESLRHDRHTDTLGDSHSPSNPPGMGLPDRDVATAPTQALEQTNPPAELFPSGGNAASETQQASRPGTYSSPSTPGQHVGLLPTGTPASTDAAQVGQDVYTTPEEWETAQKAFLERLRTEWDSLSKQEKTKRGGRWDTYKKQQHDTWKFAHPKPQDEALDEACRVIYRALTTELRGYEREGQEVINERTFIRHFVLKYRREYPDTLALFSKIYTHLTTYHIKWSSVSYCTQVTASVIYHEAQGVIQLWKNPPKTNGKSAYTGNGNGKAPNQLYVVDQERNQRNIDKLRAKVAEREQHVAVQ